jgi:hypothetical protein
MIRVKKLVATDSVAGPAIFQPGQAKIVVFSGSAVRSQLTLRSNQIGEMDRKTARTTTKIIPTTIATKRAFPVAASRRFN